MTAFIRVQVRPTKEDRGAGRRRCQLNGVLQWRSPSYCYLFYMDGLWTMISIRSVAVVWVSANPTVRSVSAFCPVQVIIFTAFDCFKQSVFDSNFNFSIELNC